MNKLVITANFKLVFLAVLGLTLLCLVITIWLAVINSSNMTMAQVPEMQRRIFESCSIGWQSGFGAMLGLIGGKLIK